MAWYGGGVIVLPAVSLAAGMLGYVAFEKLPLLDAFLNAAMLLGGMGPVDPPKTRHRRVFRRLLPPVRRAGVYRVGSADRHAVVASRAAPS
jgi:hypothetical protein